MPAIVLSIVEASFFDFSAPGLVVSIAFVFPVVVRGIQNWSWTLHGKGVVRSPDELRVK